MTMRHPPDDPPQPRAVKNFPEPKFVRQMAQGRAEHIAIVGPRCSGCTTLALLYRRYFEDHGHKVLVSVSYRQVPHYEWDRHDIVIHDGYVPPIAVCRVISVGPLV